MKKLSSTRLSNNTLSSKIRSEEQDDLELIAPLRITDAMKTMGREMQTEHQVIQEGGQYALSPARKKAKEVGPDPKILENPLIPKTRTFSGISESRLKSKAIAMLRNMKKYITKD